MIRFIFFICGLSLVCGDCDIITKKQWGGINPTHAEFLAIPLDLVIIQHTVTRSCKTDAVCEEIVRSIQTNHMEGLKFWDIAQSFLIGDNGKVYEGSGWLRVGAHTYKYNRKSIGISFIGNFNVNEPSTQALEAAKTLVKCGVEKGYLKPDYHVVAHRQLIPTESPGTKLYNEIRKWPEWLEDVSGIKIQ